MLFLLLDSYILRLYIIIFSFSLNSPLRGSIIVLIVVSSFSNPFYNRYVSYTSISARLHHSFTISSSRNGLILMLFYPYCINSDLKLVHVFARFVLFYYIARFIKDIALDSLDSSL
jgi:hypothetical protein